MRFMVEACLNTLIGLFDYEQVHRRGREVAVALGDVFRRPNMVSRQGRDGKVIWKMIYETLDPEKIVFDATAKSLHDDSLANEAKWFAYVEAYTKNDILTRFGEWILDYIEKGLEVADQPIGHHENEEFYELIEYQCKATMQHILLVGKNRFPVVWYGKHSEKPSIKKKHRGNVKYMDKYLYYDGRGIPMLMLFNFNQYYNSTNIRNYGVCDLLAGVQSVHGSMVEALIQSAIRETDSIPYMSGPGVGLNLKEQMQEFHEKKKTNSHRDYILALPSPAMNRGDMIQTGLIKFGTIDLDHINSVIGLANSLARHATGISPDQGEVRSNSVGQESILEEQKSLSIEAVIQNNLINTKRELEGMLSFAIAHNNKSLDKIPVSFDKKVIKTTGEPGIELPVPSVVVTRVSDPLSVCLDLIVDHDMFIEIDKDSMITKSLAAHSEDLIKLLGIMNPAHVPSAYKKVFKDLANSLGIQLVDSDMEGIENMTRALGGNSQFQSPTDVESAAGIQRGPGRPEEYNDSESLTPFIQ